MENKETQNDENNPSKDGKTLPCSYESDRLESSLENRFPTKKEADAHNREGHQYIPPHIESDTEYKQEKKHESYGEYPNKETIENVFPKIGVILAEEDI